MKRIYVPAVGQYDNIGDIILRRQLLDMLRPHGALHIYLGDCPRGYLEALRLDSRDVTYKSFGRWYRSLLGWALRRQANYVFKPGEIQLTLRGMKEHVGMLPALVAVRAGRGSVLRVGVGARNFSRGPRMLMRPSIALSQLSLWRDARTSAYLGGETMPDLAFAEIGVAIGDDRPLMIVSMRGDLGMPGHEWIAAITDFARTRSLELHVVTQVARDDERTGQLAKALGAESHRWDGADHLAQENALRELYGRAAAVASDRLHVLIAAVTEGAIPVAPLLGAEDKIDRHFAAAGFAPVSVQTASKDSAAIAAELGQSVAGHADLADRAARARASVAAAAEHVATHLRTVESAS